MLPKFLFENEAAIKQLKIAQGFLAGKTLAEPSLALWTASLWDDENSLRNYYTSGAHKNLMPALVNFANEAVTTRLDYAERKLPSWTFCHQQLLTNGNFSKALENPTSDHISEFISRPKVTIFTRPIKPKAR
jgi:hypothetical protein